MGIKSLSEMYTDGSVGSLSMAKLKGSRIAFDVGTWIHASWSTACKNIVNETYLFTEEVDESKIFREWLRTTLRTVEELLKNGITPVFVFDGKAPEDKNKTHKTRRDALTRARDRYNEFLQGIQGLDPLLLNADYLTEYRKLYLAARLIFYPDLEEIRSILVAAGLPCLTAEGEAERLCSALCREGWVAGVFSTDTDNLVHGCPLLLNTIKYNTFGYVHLSSLLTGLEMNHKTFVDFCICTGCDYNDNMKQIGIKRSFKLLKEYKELEQLPAKYDRTCLKEQRCRELFELIPSSTLTIDPITEESLRVSPHAVLEGRDILEIYTAEGWIPTLVTLYATLEAPIKRRTYFNPKSITLNIA